MLTAINVSYCILAKKSVAIMMILVLPSPRIIAKAWSCSWRSVSAVSAPELSLKHIIKASIMACATALTISLTARSYHGNGAVVV